MIASSSELLMRKNSLSPSSVTVARSVPSTGSRLRPMRNSCDVVDWTGASLKTRAWLTFISETLAPVPIWRTVRRVLPSTFSTAEHIILSLPGTSQWSTLSFLHDAGFDLERQTLAKCPCRPHAWHVEPEAEHRWPCWCFCRHQFPHLLVGSAEWSRCSTKG